MPQDNHLKEEQESRESKDLGASNKKRLYSDEEIEIDEELN